MNSRNLKRFSIKVLIIPLLIILPSCTTYTIKDNRIRVHHIKQHEPAPFSGVLLNDHTFNKLKQELKQCKEQTTVTKH